jgi:hypothetical protein
LPSVIVFRIALFSIVLTLAAPQASLLCKLWCQPSDAATGECHHHDQVPPASVKSDDSCAVGASSVSSFIREDSPRTATSSDAAHAVPIPRYRLVRPASELRIVESSERVWTLERRPLETTLRL